MEDIELFINNKENEEDYNKLNDYLDIYNKLKHADLSTLSFVINDLSNHLLNALKKETENNEDFRLDNNREYKEVKQDFQFLMLKHKLIYYINNSSSLLNNYISYQDLCKFSRFDIFVNNFLTDIIKYHQLENNENIGFKKQEHHFIKLMDLVDENINILDYDDIKKELRREYNTLIIKSLEILDNFDKFLKDSQYF